jgi:hypothetical protein
LLCRWLDQVQFKGREQAVWIAELVADRERASAEELDLCQRFEQIHHLRMAGRTTEALAALRECAEVHPHDRATAFLVATALQPVASTASEA